MIDRVRFSGLFSLQEWPVTLIGAGGIGGLTAITLAKMGVPDLQVWDGDKVASENTGTQFFTSFDVGSLKVRALANHVDNFAGDVELVGCPDRVTSKTHVEQLLNPIIISAVDSIKARQEIWSVLKESSFYWYLEARMGAEVFQLHTVRGSDRGWYDKILAGLDDDNVEDLPCTAKATFFTAAFGAGYIGKTVRQIATGITPPRVLIHDIVNDHLTKFE